jgi:hypothetical protein
MLIGGAPRICPKRIKSAPQATQKRFKRVSSIWGHQLNFFDAHSGVRGFWGGRSLQHDNALNHNPLDISEAELIAPPVMELRRARQGMVCDWRGFFERAPFLR